MIAILRLCRRCDALLSIESFAPLGKLCNDCMSWRASKPIRPTGRFTRGMALTAKGRDAIKDLAA